MRTRVIWCAAPRHRADECLDREDDLHDIGVVFSNGMDHDATRTPHASVDVVRRFEHNLRLDIGAADTILLVAEPGNEALIVPGVALEKRLIVVGDTAVRIVCADLGTDLRFDHVASLDELVELLASEAAHAERLARRAGEA